MQPKGQLSPKFYVTRGYKRTWDISECNDHFEKIFDKGDKEYTGYCVKPLHKTNDMRGLKEGKHWEQRLFIRNRTGQNISIGTRQGVKYELDRLGQCGGTDGTIEIGYTVYVAGLSRKIVSPDKWAGTSAIEYLDPLDAMDILHKYTNNVESDMVEIANMLKNNGGIKYYMRAGENHLEPDFVYDTNSAEDRRNFVGNPGNPDVNYLVYNRIEIFRCIHKHDLMETEDNQLYLDDFDIMVGLCPKEDLLTHPYSLKAYLARSEMGAKVPSAQGVRTAFMNMYIVDSTGMHDNLYVIAGAGVQKIPVVSHLLDKEEGVYVYTSENYSKGLDTSTKSEYYTFEKAMDALAIYESRKEAEQALDLLKARRSNPDIEISKMQQGVELEKLKRDNMLLESKMQEQAALIEAQKMKHEEEKLKMKEEFEKRAYERKDSSEARKDHYEEKSYSRKDNSDARKDHYEERSYSRKDSSESFKWIPTIVAGIGAVVAVIAKWSWVKSIFSIFA